MKAYSEEMKLFAKIALCLINTEEYLSSGTETSKKHSNAFFLFKLGNKS